MLGINKEKQEISLGMKQTQENPWDKVAERYPPGSDRQGHGPQPDQLRRVHRDRGRHRRPAARQRHVVDPQDQPSQRDGREGPGDRVQGALGRPGPPPHRPGPEAARRGSLGHRHSRASTSPASSSRARSPRSPTSASSSAWKTAWKACCTSPNWPTTRSRTPRTSSRSATRSRSRSSASITDERKIGLSRKRVEWAEEDEAEAEAAAERARPRPPAVELKGGVGGGSRPADQAAGAEADEPARSRR